jgi:hypothetical protein
VFDVNCTLCMVLYAVKHVNYGGMVYLSVKIAPAVYEAEETLTAFRVYKAFCKTPSLAEFTGWVNRNRNKFDRCERDGITLDNCIARKI